MKILVLPLLSHPGGGGTVPTQQHPGPRPGTVTGPYSCALAVMTLASQGAQLTSRVVTCTASASFHWWAACPMRNTHPARPVITALPQSKHLYGGLDSTMFCVMVITTRHNLSLYTLHKSVVHLTVFLNTSEHKHTHLIDPS